MLYNGEPIGEDCDTCPIREAELCYPSMCYDTEPPCSFSEYDNIEAQDYIKECREAERRREAWEDKQIKSAKLKAEKNAIANKRRKEAKWHVYKETEEIKRLNKRIDANEKLLSLADSLATAINITNEMFGYSERKQIVPNSQLQTEIDTYRKRIQELESIKKEKLNALRRNRKRS